MKQVIIIQFVFMFLAGNSQVWKKNYNIPADVNFGLQNFDYKPSLGGVTISMRLNNQVPAGYTNHYALAFRDNGDTMWTKRINYDSIQGKLSWAPIMAKVDNNGDRYFSGTMEEATGDTQIFVLRYDSLGNVINNYYVPCYRPQMPNSFHTTSSNFNYLLYSKDSTIMTANLNYDKYLIDNVEKRDLNGNLMWTKRVVTDTLNISSPSISNGFAHVSISTASDDNGIIFHYLNGLDPLLHNTIQKLDSNGNIVFTINLRNLISPNFDYYPQSIISTRDSGIVFIAYHQAQDGQARTYFLKINKFGLMTDSASFYANGAASGIYPTNVSQRQDGGFYAPYLKVLNGQFLPGGGILQLSKKP